MTDASTIAPAAPTGAVFRTVELDAPIVRGDQTITAIKLRKPRSGELRDLNFVDLGQLKVNALIKIMPRISMPTVTEVEVANMEPADLLACGAEIGGFLLQRSQRTDAREQ